LYHKKSAANHSEVAYVNANNSEVTVFMLRANRGFLVAFLFMALSTGCSKPAPGFDGAYIDMPLTEFQNLYSDLSQPQDNRDENGNALLVFERPARDNFRKRQYYFRNEKLIGIVILFATTTKFESVLNEFIESNGRPSQNLSVMGSRVAVWEQGKNFINITSGTSQMRVQLPTGGSVTLEPQEIMLVLGRT
jgi:hypothetical protein